jgi:hypothetical protein
MPTQPAAVSSNSASREGLAICNLRSKHLDYRVVPVRGGVNMRKRTAASPANYDFAKAYSELVKLRKEIARIEKSSRPHLSRPADCDTIKADDRARDRLQS